MTPETIYAHPDGYQLLLGDNVLMMTDPDDVLVAMPIGMPELLKLGQRLIQIANRDGTLAKLKK